MASKIDNVENSGQPTYLTKTHKFFSTIHDFSMTCQTPGVFHRFYAVFAGTKGECKWIIEMRNEGEWFKYFSISACLLNKEAHNNANFTVEFSIIDKSGKRRSVTPQSVSDSTAVIKFPNFVLKTDLFKNKSKLLANDQLKLSCQIFDLSNADENSYRAIGHSQNLLLEGFNRLFDNEKFSDFKLIVKGKEFGVHQAILAVRSPVFEAMFDSEMRETSEKKAVIDDLEPEVVEKMLRFIYTGEIDFVNLAEQILVAAEKYQLESLKLRCENELTKQLSVDNVYDILLLADANNAAGLMKRAVEFFDRNVKELVAAENFKASVNSLPPDLRTEIIYVSAMNR